MWMEWRRRGKRLGAAAAAAERPAVQADSPRFFIAIGGMVRHPPPPSRRRSCVWLVWRRSADSRRHLSTHRCYPAPVSGRQRSRPAVSAACCGWSGGAAPEESCGLRPLAVRGPAALPPHHGRQGRDDPAREALCPFASVRACPRLRPCRSAHVMTGPQGEGKRLAALFAGSEEWTHSGKHFVPQNTAACKRVAEFLAPHCLG